MKTKVFLTLLAINLITINTQACNLINPTRSEDCTNKSITEKELCCHLTAPNLTTKNNLCYSIPYASYAGGSTYYHEGHTYFINCGVKVEKPALPTCGGLLPEGYADCEVGSSYTNSCCFAEVEKKCVWLGTKFEGETTWAGMKLECNNYYYTLPLLMILAFIAFLS